MLKLTYLSRIYGVEVTPYPVCTGQVVKASQGHFPQPVLDKQKRTVTNVGNNEIMRQHDKVLMKKALSHYRFIALPCYTLIFAPMSDEFIEVQGARVHNLRNIDISIPKISL